MRKNILHHLFDGEIYPSENIGIDNPDLKLIREMLVEERELLLKTLTDDNREHFENVEDLHSRTANAHSYECFVHGFKLGTMLLHEALSNAEALTRNTAN